MAEALERMLLTRFLLEMKPLLPNSLNEYSVEPTETLDPQLLQHASPLFAKYESYRENVRMGSIGKTAQFWLLYMDLMKIQILIHNAVQTNNFEALLYGWESFIPMFFAMNKVNYAR